MPVPTFDRFIEPLIRFLSVHPEGVPSGVAHDAAAAALSLTDEDKLEILPSGTQRIYKNRVGWAHDRLKRAGYSSSPRRGFWQITPEGHAFLLAHPSTFDSTLLGKIASGYLTVRLRPESGDDDTSVESLLEQADSSAISPVTASPDDRLDAALREIRSSVSTELLEVVRTVSPAFFETLVLDLLHRMGYGATRDDLQRVGGSGDGGIDGVISLDKLGLEKVYVQAKRWTANNVGRPEVQGFYGAIAGQRATKGIFITVSAFTQQALDFAKSVEGVVLVDGRKLTELMIDNEIGVTLRPVRIPRLDTDYFDDEVA